MKKNFKQLMIAILAMIMIMEITVPASAASKYGEDKPLKSTQISQRKMNSGHNHTFVTCSNGCTYQLYHSCMAGMTGFIPTNHASIITIDGVRYYLRNLRDGSGSIKFANVIQIINSSQPAPTPAPAPSTPKPVTPTPGTSKYPLKGITMSHSSLAMNVGYATQLSVSYNPSNTTDSKTVTWTSSNSSIVSVSGGKITAKGPGTATITAKVGTKTTTCKITVKAPLKSISLNKTSATLAPKGTLSLSVSYNPWNTTDSKSVSWSSSNTSVATVSGGKITAKKAGSATITARVGSRSASCKVTVKAATNQVTTGYKDVTQAYTLLNQFRTTKANQWYWNKTNKKKIKTPGLKKLKKDNKMESIAKLRAKEQWTMGYERGRFVHTRPNGKDWSTAYPKGVSIGENLAWGQTTCKEVIMSNDGWAETNCKYKGQGHRRSMLSKEFTKVGIACYTKNGRTCWAMSLAK